MTDSTTNPLAAVLTELGWKPETLARRLSSLAALHGRAEQVHAKTPYKWLHGAALDRGRGLARPAGRHARWEHGPANSPHPAGRRGLGAHP
ncbi:MAG: hypothetical protein ACRDTF_18530 [Pseudonocardiaceae bacterium]